MKGKALWSLWISLIVVGTIGEEIGSGEEVLDTFNAIRSLREQVNALLVHRQQDYNALEGSLKRAIEKNTELFVLKDEVKQLRKEVIALRGGGTGNEAKNEKLRVRWLGNAVTELQSEVAEVLRMRNASEEFAERSRMRGELTMVKGDISAVGKGIRNLGGRIAKIEAALGTIRIDIAAVKERVSLLSRSCADIASQLSTVQMEVKSLRNESPLADIGSSMIKRKLIAETATNEVARRSEHELTVRRKLMERHRARVVVRLKNLERKMSLTIQRRESLEKLVAYENERWSKLNERVNKFENIQTELSRRLSNVSENALLTKSIDETFGMRLVGWLRTLEEAVETNNSSTKQELLRLGVNAARKAAELSVTREELSNLRRTVQALSVSASKLQERSDKQQEVIDRLNNSRNYSQSINLGRFPAIGSPNGRAVLESSVDDLPFDHVEQLEDRYHTIVNDLPMSCEERGSSAGTNDLENGLRLLQATRGQQQQPVRPVLVFCRKDWIVIGRRIDGSLDFDRSWNEYAIGFGSPVNEYWIGNEILHQLTRDNCSSLRVDLVDIYGQRWRAEYSRFAVESKETGYKLHVYGYRGNATDALSYQNGMPFSARDRDMDASVTHCASNYHGGWWFNRCQHANLNGRYSLGLTWFRTDTDRWMSIASAEMSLRRNSNCLSR